jgi:N-acetylmuramoyl-L-alanine amidase
MVGKRLEPRSNPLAPAVVTFALLLALLLASALLPAPRLAAADSPSGSPENAFPLLDRAEGSIVGQSGGAFAYYSLRLAPTGTPIRVEATFSSTDGSAVLAAGAKVYGPANGKTYASLVPTKTGTPISAEFQPDEAGIYLVQVFSYTPAQVGFTVTATGPRVAGRARTIALDPGHGGPEVGAASGDLLEKQVNLRIALKLADLLRAGGHRVVLTRDSDRAVSPLYTNTRSSSGQSADLQARVDIANAAHADLFLCIHNNGGPAAQSGTEVWFNRARPFAARNQRLAELTLNSLVRQIRALGYPVRDRGIKPDDYFRVVGGQTYNLFVLGPNRPQQPHTPTAMPGALGESLFLSNPDDVAMLRQEKTQDAIARGYYDAIAAYFEAYPD